MSRCRQDPCVLQLWWPLGASTQLSCASTGLSLRPEHPLELGAAPGLWCGPGTHAGAVQVAKLQGAGLRLLRLQWTWAEVRMTRGQVAGCSGQLPEGSQPSTASGYLVDACVVLDRTGHSC